jgi:hypothetical protein
VRREDNPAAAMAKLIYSVLNFRFDMFIIFMINYFFSRRQRHIDSEILFVINFVNLRLKLAQSFRTIHRYRVCIRVFIGISLHLYYICIKKKFSPNLARLQSSFSELSVPGGTTPEQGLARAMAHLSFAEGPVALQSFTVGAHRRTTSSWWVIDCFKESKSTSYPRPSSCLHPSAPLNGTRGHGRQQEC